MKRLGAILITASVLLTSSPSQAIKLGLETDLAAFVTGGFNVGVWYGQDEWRIRAVWSQIRVPDQIVRKDFSDMRIVEFALMGDYFPDRGSRYEKQWASAGLALWYNRVGHKDEYTVSSFKSLVIPVQAGYLWGHYDKVWNNWYLNPWAGLHLRLLGAGDVAVGGQTYKPLRVIPAISLKLGSEF